MGQARTGLVDGMFVRMPALALLALFGIVEITEQLREQRGVELQRRRRLRVRVELQ